jgi:hypothetical protein
MLFQTERIGKLYGPIAAKAAPPQEAPQTDALLSYASNWFSIDLKTIQTDGSSVLAYLGQPCLWDCLAEMGIDGVELQGLKSKGPQINFQIDSEFGTEAEYTTLVSSATKKGICLIGKTIGNVTGKGADFALALQNVGTYPELYSMVEIPQEDWALLPMVNASSLSANVPWLTVQKLHKKGYIPSHFAPYVKQSAWNVTKPIQCEGKMRRWIYLRDEQGNPYLDWLSPTFGALKIAAADCLNGMFHFGWPILALGELPPNTEQTLSLTIRKLGRFSVGLARGGVGSLDGCTDATYDHLLPMASLHALLSEDAEALRLLYNLLLSQKISPQRLVHALEPFGRLPNDWAEFLESPDKKHLYHQEELTASELQSRLLREDTFRIKGLKEGTYSWNLVADSPPAIDICDLEKKRTVVISTHSMLAKFFAWQPGVFSLSLQDLLGAAPKHTKIDPLSPNADCLYSCAPSQLQNPCSFASQLKSILRVRKELRLEKADLVEVVESEQKSVLILRYLLPQNQAGIRRTALLLVNFGGKECEVSLESYAYAHATAIDPMTHRTENKVFDSSFFELKINPLTARLVVFQPKYGP